jgi:hypothetical protein
LTLKVASQYGRRTLSSFGTLLLVLADAMEGGGGSDF